MKRFVDEKDLVERLSRDWMRIKTIAEDAAVTEFRYRALVCVQRTPHAPRGARVLVEHTGIDTVARAGGVEQQGADMLLLRADGTARAEYDVAGCGGGRRRLRIEQFALGAERSLALGLTILVDGIEAGTFPSVTSGGTDRVLAHEIDVDVPDAARRIVLETLPLPGGARTHARVKRIVLSTIQGAVRAEATQPA
jgi:hypothetical protein